MSEDNQPPNYAIGVLQGRLDGVEKRIDRLQADTSDQNVKLDQILAIVSAAKGGIRMLLTLGSAGAAIGALIHWVYGILKP